MLWFVIPIFLAVGAAVITVRWSRRRRRPAVYLPEPPPTDAAAGDNAEAPSTIAESTRAAESTPPPPVTPSPIASQAQFHVSRVIESDGSPEGENRVLEVRRAGVTGTDARKLVRLDGTQSDQRERLMTERLSGIIRDRSASSVSAARKPAIAALLEREFSIVHNTMLCFGTDPRHLATCDGIGDRVISEIKVSGKTWDQTARSYRDELQWQLHVTGSERILLAVEGRHSRLLQHGWIDRDESRIAQLVEHADLFIVELDERCGTPERNVPQCSAPAIDFLPSAPVIAVEREEAEPLVDPEPTWSRSSTTSASSELPDDTVVPEYPEWSVPDSMRLLHAYAEGRDLLSIARQFDARLGAVAHELTRWVLNAHGALVDRSVENYGMPWSDDDKEALSRDYRDGVQLSVIAQRLGRDQQSVAFQLLNTRQATVPEEILAFRLDDVELLESAGAR